MLNFRNMEIPKPEGFLKKTAAQLITGSIALSLIGCKPGPETSNPPLATPAPLNSGPITEVTRPTATTSELRPRFKPSPSPLSQVNCSPIKGNFTEVLYPECPDNIETGDIILIIPPVPENLRSTTSKLERDITVPAPFNDRFIIGIRVSADTIQLLAQIGDSRAPAASDFWDGRIEGAIDLTQSNSFKVRWNGSRIVSVWWNQEEIDKPQPRPTVTPQAPFKI